jgi:hypothetical protein
LIYNPIWLNEQQVRVEKNSTHIFVPNTSNETFNEFRNNQLGEVVVLIGQRKAVAMAVKNKRTENRFSGLLARLLAPD